MSKIFKAILLCSFFFVITGCSFKVDYDRSYVDLKNAPLPTIQGKALIYTEEDEDNRTYSQSPTSFTGGGTKLDAPVGKILKEISSEVFNKVFTDGADLSNDKNKSGDYTVVIHPEINGYEYRYNQLKNLGFAITPEVNISINVYLYNKQGTEVFSKTYRTSGYESSGDTYFASLEPEEEVNSTIHQTIMRLLIQASKDIKKAL